MILTFTALSLALAQAAAASPAIKTRETAHKAWMMRCETRTDPKPDVTLCGLVSTVTAQIKDENRSTILTKILLRPAPAQQGAYQLSFELPLGVLLPAGALVADAQGKEIARLPFILCRQNGCEAGGVLSAAQLGHWRGTGEKASVVYDLPSGKRVKIDFSMAGMEEAFTQLQAESAGL